MRRCTVVVAAILGGGRVVSQGPIAVKRASGLLPAAGARTVPGMRRVSTSLRALLPIAAAGVAAATLVPTPVPAAAATGCTLSPANFSAAMSGLAGPSKVGWIASDGFTSARLNDHQVLFSNQDTFWGRSDGANRMLSGSMRHNSIIIYDDRSPTCMTAQAGVDDGGFFSPGTDPSQSWLWPGQPEVSGTTVVVPLGYVALGSSPGAGSFNFVKMGTSVGTYRFTGSTLVPLSVRSFTPTGAEPGGEPFEWEASIVYGDYVYLGATHLRSGQWGHDLFLARVPKSVWFAPDTGLAGRVEFLTGDGWKVGARYDQLRPIIYGQGDAAVSFTTTADQFHIVTKQYSMLGSTIVDWHAPTPDGVYEQTPVAPAPTKAGTWSYWANLHPELVSAGLSRVATLNFNNAQDLGWGNLNVMDRYRPTMFNVVLPQTVRVHTGSPSATVFGNLTVTGSALPGVTVAWPCDGARPNTSNINFGVGAATANALVMRTDAKGDFCVASTVAAQVVFDKAGASPDVASHNPVRTVDTRTGGEAPLPAGSVLRVHTGAPGGSTVLGNLTATGATRTGYTTVWSCDESRPATSTNNYSPNRTSANMTAVRTNAAGDFCVYTSSAVHLVFDQVAETDALPLAAPVRIVDTRTGGAKLPAGQVLRIPTGTGPTVVGNLTAVAPSSGGYLTAWSCDTPRPLVSTLNFTAGQTVPNMVVARTSASGDLCVYSTAATHLLFDRYSAPTDGRTAPMSAPLTDPVPRRMIDTRNTL